ncbi:SRPBCC family protein [Plantactinospora sonchi]|uniref:SRPBCC family protein n=1 Tax=Plantactinospora sonchi TaxID=1544735 RepID=A0ABU7RRM2_9ACTN
MATAAQTSTDTPPPRPSAQLGDALRDLATAAGQRAAATLTHRIGGTTDRLTRYAEGGAHPGLATTALAAVGGKVAAALGRRGRGNARSGPRVTNIVESVDVGVPARIAYDQWTRFDDFPSFMKKVESVTRTSDTESTWKARILWSHREWHSTVVEQVPDRRIVWRSDGAKGSVDGAVTFHEIGPELTRILLVLEYHPQGLFERTGNLWRAQGRRARLELKHFARHVMTRTILDPDQATGWRGEIHGGEVTRDPERSERRPADSGRSRNTSRSADSGRSQDTSRSADTGRSRDTSRSADTGRSGDTGRSRTAGPKGEQGDSRSRTGSSARAGGGQR